MNTDLAACLPDDLGETDAGGNEEKANGFDPAASLSGKPNGDTLGSAFDPFNVDDETFGIILGVAFVFLLVLLLLRYLVRRSERKPKPANASQAKKGPQAKTILSPVATRNPPLSLGPRQIPPLTQVQSSLGSYPKHNCSSSKWWRFTTFTIARPA